MLARAPYSLLMLWRDRHRFLPALMAVGFSAVLIAVQFGLVLGLVLCASAPIDHAAADIWVLPNDAPSLHQTSYFPSSWRARLDVQPEIARSESYLTGMGRWHKPGRGNTDLCFLIGVRLDDGSLGALDALTPELRAKLAEPGAVVVDRWDLKNLDLKRGVGEKGEINNHQVQVVGTLEGFHGHNFIYIFCSHETMALLVPAVTQYPDLATCLVARCHDPRDVPRVVQRLRQVYPDMGSYTRNELSVRVRNYWLLRSRGGMVMICTMVLAMLVGLVITSQTLFAAVVAQMREFAVLEALGIPRRRMVGLVLAQAFWLGLGGLVMALPIIYFLGAAALLLETRVILSHEIFLLTFGLTMGMSLAAGLSALRPLRTIEPAHLLR